MAEKRALITGINGFTGHYLRAELELAGWGVFGTGLQDVSDDPNYRRVDLNDMGRLRQVIAELKPHAVIHLAGVAYVGHGDANAFYSTNVIGTRNLLVALIEENVCPRRVLLASSGSVYGNIEGILSESVCPRPANDYAVSKLAMECMARLWFEDLPIVIVRPFNYSGVGQIESFLLPKIVAHFRRRDSSIELGNIDVWRDFSDVRAVAFAYRRLLEVDSIGETINICSGRMRSLREVINIAESITGHQIQIIVKPSLLRRSEVKKLCGDPSKLRELIGIWDPPALEETLRWMLNEGH